MMSATDMLAEMIDTILGATCETGSETIDTSLHANKTLDLKRLTHLWAQHVQLWILPLHVF